MLRFVVAGLSKDQLAQVISHTGGAEVTVERKSDIEAAMAIKAGQADYYIGACNSGAGAALAICTALLGADKTVTLAAGGAGTSAEAIKQAVDGGKTAFGLRNTDIDRVVPDLVRELIAKARQS